MTDKEPKVITEAVASASESFREAVNDQSLRSLLTNKWPDFLLQEYWQLRQEIRDRQTSIRAILAGTVTAFTATVAFATTMMGSKNADYFVGALAWMIPFCFIIPGVLMVFSEHMAIINMARYVRLHCELPFFEFVRSVRRTGRPLEMSNGDARYPVGWETYLFYLRKYGNKVKEHEKEHVGEGHSRVGEDGDPQENSRRSEAAAAAQAVHLDGDLGRAIQTIDLRDAYAAKAVSYTFVGMAVISTVMFAICTALAIYNQFDTLTKSLTIHGLGLAVLLCTFVCVRATLYVYKKCRRFEDSCRVSSFVDLKDLDDVTVDAFLALLRK